MSVRFRDPKLAGFLLVCQRLERSTEPGFFSEWSLITDFCSAPSCQVYGGRGKTRAARFGGDVGTGGGKATFGVAGGQAFRGMVFLGGTEFGVREIELGIRGGESMCWRRSLSTSQGLKPLAPFGPRDCHLGSFSERCPWVCNGQPEAMRRRLRRVLGWERLRLAAFLWYKVLRKEWVAPVQRAQHRTPSETALSLRLSPSRLSAPGIASGDVFRPSTQTQNP